MEKAILSKNITPHYPLNDRQSKELGKLPGTDDSGLLPFVIQNESGNHIVLHVNDIRCAKCISTIESCLKKEKAINFCRVNMSTNRLAITWQGKADLIDDFAKKINQAGYQLSAIQTDQESKNKESDSLLRYMAIAGFAMGNIMLISVTLWSSDRHIMGVATREFLHWVSAMIALPTVFYSGRPFFLSALSALKAKRTNMDLPISLALILTSLMSVHETIIGAEHAYFDSVVMLLFFLLIGRWLDAKVRNKARAHASELLALLSGTATLIKHNKTHKVKISDLSPGDQIMIAVGEKIPSDARVIEGTSEIDTSIVTGESIPKKISVGSTLYGGTINLTAPLICNILQPSNDSLLANVIRLMEQAEQGRAKYRRLADKAASLYTPVVHLLAIGAFIGWFFFGDLAWQQSLLIAITTLIITCPCALALAVPAVQVLAMEWLMKRAILVKNGEALEKLSTITTIVFDKTGTLSEGKIRLNDHKYDPMIKKIAASLADYSRHPLSRSISAHFKVKRLDVSDVNEKPGIGLEGVIAGKRYFLGKDLDHKAKHQMSVLLKQNDQEMAGFTFKDKIRQGAGQTIASFQNQGIKTVMLSGDHPVIANKMASELAIGEVKASMLPDQKQNFIQSLQKKGERCLMVGDGLNDAPALAQADVSMSPSTGMDITQNTADIVFQGKSLESVFSSWQLSRFTTNLIKQNFALAVIYNCCAIPLAVMGYVTPFIAAIAMSASSLIVIGNSFRVRLMKAHSR
ncbi:MAG: heavy metal translocating P-type ATPase [Pseudomonadota bacterium]